jgi:TonB family protein
MILEQRGKAGFRERRRAWIVLLLLCVFALSLHAAEERAVKSRVAPVYPEIAKRMKIGGAVKLEVTVDAEGKVVDVKPISGSRVLSEAAEEAVRKWRFVPGPSQSVVDVDLNFDLAQ